MNDGQEPVRRICLEEKEGLYTLYEGEEEREVTVRIMKYSEAAFGKCLLELQGKPQLSAGLSTARTNSTPG